MVCEIESKTIRSDQGTLLADMVTEHVPQRCVQQVRGRMVAPDGRPAHYIDLRSRLLPGEHFADQASTMGMETRKHGHGIDDVSDP